MNAKVFWAWNAEKYNLRSLWQYIVPVMVRWLHCIETFEGRWWCLTKCGVTDWVMDRRSHDGPSCWFIMKIRDVVPVPKFQEFKCYWTETLDKLLCLWRFIILVVENNQESSRRICKLWDGSVHDDPSWPRIPVARYVTQPRFYRFPANRVFPWLGFCFFINC